MGEKTNLVSLHAPNKPVQHNFDQIKMDVTRVKTFQYLGVYFDETLEWTEYVDFVCNLLIKYFWIFNHIKNKIIKPIMRQVYHYLSIQK